MLLHEKLAPYRLLLASQSPRRRELMSGCGLPYELAPKFDCEERYPAELAAEEVPRYLSRLAASSGRRSTTTSIRSAPSTRPGRTASRSGSDTPPSNASKDRSTTSWDSPYRNSMSNWTNS